jgi:hypothetical protein
MGIQIINGKKYLDKHVLECLITAAGDKKTSFEKELAKLDAKQERRNAIQRAVQARQAEFYGLPPNQMGEKRKKIEDEEIEKIDTITPEA